MTTRRSFIGSILACAAAPAIVKAEILMPVRKIIVPAIRLEPPLFEMEIGRWDGFRFIESKLNEPPTWYTGQAGLSQADQMALNREFRRMLDNVGVAPRFQTVIGDKRRADLDARLNAAWSRA